MEVLEPPVGSKAGDRVFVQIDHVNHVVFAEKLELKVNDKGNVQWEGRDLKTSSGNVTSKRLKGVDIG